MKANQKKMKGKFNEIKKMFSKSNCHRESKTTIDANIPFWHVLLQDYLN